MSKRSNARAIGAAIAFFSAAHAASALGPTDFSLTVLHSSDQESAIVPTVKSGFTYGGAALFTSVFTNLKSSATTNGVISLSGGDDFLVGPAFDSSLTKSPAVPYYDALVERKIGYDAINVSNHYFDLGPTTAANFMNSFTAPDPAGGIAPSPGTHFVSTNLNFSGENVFNSLVSSGTLAKSAIITTGGQQIGVIGAITPTFPTLTSPGHVTMTTPTTADLAAAINAEAASLAAQGVNKIIAITKLQNVANDRALVPLLHGIDIDISSGGHEVMTAPAGASLIPGDTATGGTYASGLNLVNNADGQAVPIISAGDSYKYVGKLVVNFSPTGVISSIDTANSGNYRVIQDTSATPTLPDSVTPNAVVQSEVVNPVQAHIASLATTVVATSVTVPLDGRRPNPVRQQESNEADLVADAFKHAALVNGPAAGLTLDPARTVAIQNGGGLRDNRIFTGSTMTRADTFAILPFSNFVDVFTSVTPSQIKAILEQGVSVADTAPDGRFTQVSGMKYVWDSTQPVGSRIVSLVLDDGTKLVDHGQLVPGAPSVALSLNSFSAKGGDGYPDLPANGFSDPIQLPLTDEQALEQFITDPIATGGLNGIISATDYPAAGLGRITLVPEPGSLALLGVGALLLARRKQRRTRQA